MASTEEIINALGGTNSVAETLELAPSTVSGWKTRPGGIPSPHWASVVRLAADRGRDDVTLELLADLAAARRPFRADESDEVRA